MVCKLERSLSIPWLGRYLCKEKSWTTVVSLAEHSCHPQTSTSRCPRLSCSSRGTPRNLLGRSSIYQPSKVSLRHLLSHGIVGRTQFISLCCFSLSIRRRRQLHLLWRRIWHDSFGISTEAHIAQFYKWRQTTQGFFRASKQGCMHSWLSL